jgi:hypothetical protein
LRQVLYFRSDLGHYDLVDMHDAAYKAWESVEHGMLTEEDFRDFVFANPVRLTRKGAHRALHEHRLRSALRSDIRGTLINAFYPASGEPPPDQRWKYAVDPTTLLPRYRLRRKSRTGLRALV